MMLRSNPTKSWMARALLPGMSAEERVFELGRMRGQKGREMAERVGFEPTIPVKVCPLSRRIVSTTHAPLRAIIRASEGPKPAWIIPLHGGYERTAAIARQTLQQA